MLFDSGPLDSYRWMNHLWALDIFTILFYFSNLIRVFFLLIRLNLCLTNVPLALPEHSITHSKWKFRKSKQKNWTVRKKGQKLGFAVRTTIVAFQIALFIEFVQILIEETKTSNGY